MKATKDCEYDGENREPFVVSPWGDCEHVAFHKCMRDKHNATIVIDKYFLQTEKAWIDMKRKKSLKVLEIVNILMLVLFSALAAIGVWRFACYRAIKEALP